MKPLHYILAALLCTASPLPAFAADKASSLTTYSRSELGILRKGLKMDPSLLPWQQQKAIQDSKLMFQVEVRDGRTLYGQEGWFNLTSYDDDKGVLLAFNPPAQTPIISSAQYAPVDILFIDREGTIIQIAPKIQLAELEQQIMPQAPVSAFLFLKSGICEKLVINPGDTVDYALFKPSPVILGAPDKSKVVPAPAQLQPDIHPQQKALENLYGTPDAPKPAAPLSVPVPATNN